MCNGVLSHKLHKEPSGDDFIPKISFYSKAKRCLRICIEKVACRYYMQLSLVAYKEQKGKPQNGDNKKTKYAKFSENRKFLNP